MRKTIVVAIFAALWLGGCTPAKDTPERRIEQAREAARLEVEQGLFDVSLDRAAGIALTASAGTLEQELGRPANDGDRERLRGILRKELSQFLTREAWIKVTSEVYARHLTSDELGDLVGFFKSRAGTKLLTIQPELSKEMGDAAEALFAENQAAFAERVDKAVTEAFPEIAAERKK